MDGLEEAFLHFVCPQKCVVYAFCLLGDVGPQGRTLSRVITNPVNSTSGLQNVNLSGFNVMPFLPQTSGQWMAWKKLSSILSAHRSVSSMHFVFWGMSATISSYRLEYLSPEPMYPCGVTQYLYRPHGVMNVVRWRSSG